MANNLIQIKRSLNTSSPGSLANGELAYTSNGDVLFIGANGTTVSIGGKRDPGFLTANQALVANATAGIDKIIVANAAISQLNANGGAGTAGQVLKSGGPGSNSYWSDTAAGVAGSDTQVQFNDGGSLAGDSGLTYNKTTDTLTVVGSVLSGATVNATTLSIGSSSIVNATGVYTTGVVNGATVSVGTSVIANSTRLAIGTAVGFQANGTIGSSGQILYSNGTTAYWDAPPDGDITSVTAGNGLTGGGTSGAVTIDVGAGNGITVAADSISVNAGDGLSVNSLGVHARAGNTQVVSNASGIYIDQTKIDHDQLSNYVANKHVDHSSVSITAGNGLTGGGDITTSRTLSVSAGDGISVNSAGVHVRANSGITSNSSGTFVKANNGIIANTDGVFVNGGSTLTVNAAGAHVNSTLSITSLTTSGDVTVNGNTKLGDAATDVVSFSATVNTHINPTANVTYSLGNNTSRWYEVHAQNVHSTFGYFDGSVEISGNLTVLGDVLTVNVSSLAVEDSLIQLAVNNTVSDSLDIGFYGNYQVGGGDHEHAGLFRDASDDGKFKLFLGLTEAPTATVNTTGTGYTTGTLVTYLNSGGLTTNSTSANLIANGTYSVGIVANTLTLSTALAGTSGGTGRSTSTNNALLVGNSTNGYNELTLGTSGYVLQSNGSALVYDTLDGGTF